MIIVAVIFLNGVFLKLWVTPHFDKYAKEWGEYERSKRFEKIAGAAALISATGWFLAFVLGYIIAN